MLSNNKVVCLVVSVAVAFSSVFSVANAQDDAGTLEEIIVTYRVMRIKSSDSCDRICADPGNRGGAPEKSTPC